MQFEHITLQPSSYWAMMTATPSLQLQSCLYVSCDVILPAELNANLLHSMKKIFPNNGHVHICIYIRPTKKCPTPEFMVWGVIINILVCLLNFYGYNISIIRHSAAIHFFFKKVLCIVYITIVLNKLKTRPVSLTPLVKINNT